MEKLMTPADVAEYLQCSLNTATVIMEKAGCINIGSDRVKLRRIPEENLRAYLTTRTVASEQPMARTVRTTRKAVTQSMTFEPVPGNPNGCIVHIPRKRA